MDHFLCPHEHPRWNRQAKSFGCLEIDHQFKLNRLLYRQVGGLRSLEDLVDVDGGTPYKSEMLGP